MPTAMSRTPSPLMSPIPCIDEPKVPKLTALALYPLVPAAMRVAVKKSLVWSLEWFEYALTSKFTKSTSPASELPPTSACGRPARSKVCPGCRPGKTARLDPKPPSHGRFPMLSRGYVWINASKESTFSYPSQAKR